LIVKNSAGLTIVESSFFNHTSLFRFARAVYHENGRAMHQYGLILESFREMIRVEPPKEVAISMVPEGVTGTPMIEPGIFPILLKQQAFHGSGVQWIHHQRGCPTKEKGPVSYYHARTNRCFHRSGFRNAA
jgi:hypothetical protein